MMNIRDIYVRNMAIMTVWFLFIINDHKFISIMTFMIKCNFDDMNGNSSRINKTCWNVTMVTNIKIIINDMRVPMNNLNRRVCGGYTQSSPNTAYVSHATESVVCAYGRRLCWTLSQTLCLSHRHKKQTERSMRSMDKRIDIASKIQSIARCHPSCLKQRRHLLRLSIESVRSCNSQNSLHFSMQT